MQLISAPGLKGLPAGIQLDYAGATAPAGSLLCYGQNVSRTTYAALFTAIGTTYGAGDGSTTFALPDSRGRATFGKDNMGGSAANRVTNGVSGITGTTLGAAGGDERLHAHTHTYNEEDASAAFNDLAAGAEHGEWSRATGSTGGGAAQNMPPAIIMNKIITTGGV